MPATEQTPLPTAFVERPRVLVVDDEPSIRLVARIMLERAGYVIEELGGAAEAVRRAEQAERPFAVALLDVSLPDRNGIEVLPELRALAPNARFVLMSGRSEEDVPGHGADGYLPKPFTRDQLLTALRAVLTAAPR